MPTAPPSGRSPVERVEFARLFRPLYQQLVGFFRNRGFDMERAEDLAQDTLVQAYRRLDEFRRDASLRTWVFSIAWNLWRNALRHDQAQKRSAEIISTDTFGDDIEELRLLGDGAIGPLDSTLANERRGLLRDQIESLPPQMRECLSRYVYNGQKYKDIADDLGISLNTVKSAISQAKSRLQDDLRQGFPELREKDAGEDRR